MQETETGHIVSAMFTCCNKLTHVKMQQQISGFGFGYLTTKKAHDAPKRLQTQGVVGVD